MTTTAVRIAIFQSPGTLLLPSRSPPEPGQYQFGGESNFTSIITLSLVTEGFRWKNVNKTAAQLIPLSITASAVLCVRTTGHRERSLTDAARHGTCPPTSTRWCALLSSWILQHRAYWARRSRWQIEILLNLKWSRWSTITIIIPELREHCRYPHHSFSVSYITTMTKPRRPTDQETKNTQITDYHKDEAAKMYSKICIGRWSFWSLLDVNRSTVDEHMREKQFLRYSLPNDLDFWVFDLYTLNLLP